MSDPVAPSSPASVRAARRSVTAAILVTAGALGVPVALSHRGSAARSPEPAVTGRVEVVTTDTGVTGLWLGRGLKGRTVVHAGRFLHFVEPTGLPTPLDALRSPGTGLALDRRIAANVRAESYLWAAAELRIARRFFFVAPRPTLESRLEALGRSPAELPLRIDATAVPRTLDAVAPDLDEPVLLDINASWFDASDAADLRSALRDARLLVELATVSLAEDAPDVSPAARAAARAFAEELARVLPRSPP
jgi:hypothetical protein